VPGRRWSWCTSVHGDVWFPFVKGFNFAVVRRRIVSICEIKWIFFYNNELDLLTTICTPSQSVFCVTLCVNLTTFELWSVYRYQNG